MRRRPTTLLLLSLFLGCDPTGEQPNIGTCLISCADGKASPTDRATCRLNCGVAYKLPPASPPPPLTPVAHCMGACVGPGAAEPACLDACRDPAVAPAVLDALASCVADCHAGGPHGDDDRATCRLLCAQEVALSP